MDDRQVPGSGIDIAAGPCLKPHHRIGDASIPGHRASARLLASPAEEKRRLITAVRMRVPHRRDPVTPPARERFARTCRALSVRPSRAVFPELCTRRHPTARNRRHAWPDGLDRSHITPLHGRCG